MTRLISSILAGFLTTAVLSTATDHVLHTTGVYAPYGQPLAGNGLALLALFYRGLYAVLGAYLTAVLAKEQARQAVFTLGGIGAGLWLIGAIVMWDYAPAWYNISGVVLGLPFALIGGRLCALRTNRFNQPTAL